MDGMTLIVASNSQSATWVQSRMDYPKFHFLNEPEEECGREVHAMACSQQEDVQQEVRIQSDSVPAKII